MNALRAHPPELDRFLEALRAARFPHGIRCPRCGHTRTQRWGSFSGRQRYLCTGCRRTFSDLTGTPAAYSKKLLLWDDYGRCLAEGLSVRRAGRRLRIHPCTAFRWRHAIIAALRARDDESLDGWIELCSVSFRYSEKGRRRLSQPRRRAARDLRHAEIPRANVLIACDRRGRLVTALAGVSMTTRIHSHQLDGTLSGRVRGRPAIVAAQGRFAPPAILARRLGWAIHGLRSTTQPPRSLVHLHAAHAYRARLCDWLQRFRGVATRYLPNYLAWHRAIDATWRLRMQAEALRWPVGAAPT
jgi:transposase-like protein